MTPEEFLSELSVVHYNLARLICGGDHLDPKLWHAAVRALEGYEMAGTITLSWELPSDWREMFPNVHLDSAAS